MADSIRELIIQEIAAEMGAYAFVNLSGVTVIRGRVNYDANIDSLPQISILPRPEEATRDDYGNSVCLMPVNIHCLVALEDYNASELGEAVLAEMIRSVMSIDSSNANDIAYVSGGVEDYPNQLGQKVLEVGIVVAVEYRFEIGNPYQLPS